MPHFLILPSNPTFLPLFLSFFAFVFIGENSGHEKTKLASEKLRRRRKMTEPCGCFITFCAAVSGCHFNLTYINRETSLSLSLVALCCVSFIGNFTLRKKKGEGKEKICGIIEVCGGFVVEKSAGKSRPGQRKKGRKVSGGWEGRLTRVSARRCCRDCQKSRSK